MLHLVPRSVALERGFRHYFTGRPCVRGHIYERRTDNKRCVLCNRLCENRRRADPVQRAARKEYDRQRWILKREQIQARVRAYNAKNAERLAEMKRAYWVANFDRLKERRKEWVEKNRHVIRELNAARKKQIVRATPPWVDRSAIREVYEEADRLTADTGILHHVDHIVPLQGETVCGLHVPWNLRAIPWVENVRKKNKLIEDLAVAS